MLNISQAVTRSVSRTFDYKGRARRSEYWWTSLFLLVVISASGTIDAMIVPEMSEADMQNYFGGGWKEWLLDWKYTPLSTGLYYLALPTMIAVTARRMHDVGRAAWIGIVPVLAMELIIFFPFTGLETMSITGQFELSPALTVSLAFALIILVLGLYALILSIRDSERISNRFGPSPKYSDEADAFD